MYSVIMELREVIVKRLHYRNTMEDFHFLDTFKGLTLEEI